MAQFVGKIMNNFPNETGVNITIMEREDEKTILAPRRDMDFDRAVDGDTLKFKLRPSAGGTEESRIVNVEVKGGEGSVNQTENVWEVTIKSSSSSTQCIASVSIYLDYSL